MARGQWVEHRGKKRPPVYTPRHSTILRELGVTDEEAAGLDVIIPHELARERHRLRDRKQHEANRRAAGNKPRQEWLESLEQKRANAKLMRASGKTWKEVAELCGYPSAEAARKAAA